MSLAHYLLYFLHKNVCYGYPLEVPQQGASNEYPQHNNYVFIEKLSKLSQNFHQMLFLNKSSSNLKISSVTADFDRYHIQPNYHTYPYKCTVKQFHSLQITACVLFVYFYIKTYIVGTHLNCIGNSNEYPQHKLL